MKQKLCYNCGKPLNSGIWQDGFPYCENCWKGIFGGVAK